MQQRAQESLVIALVQADGWFVKDVHDADETGADLTCQPDALCFAPGKRFSTAIDRKIIEADVAQKSKPFADLLDDPVRNRRAPAFELHLFEKRLGTADRHCSDFVECQVRDEDIAGRAIQPRSAALGTELAVQEACELLAHGARLGLPVAAVQVRDNTFEAVVLPDLHAT